MRLRRRREPSIIREVALLRAPRPGETVILTVDERWTTADTMMRLQAEAQHRLGCRVLILPSTVSITQPQE